MNDEDEQGKEPTSETTSIDWLQSFSVDDVCLETMVVTATAGSGQIAGISLDTVATWYSKGSTVVVIIGNEIGGRSGSTCS